MVYLPKEKLLIEADAFTPGAAERAAARAAESEPHQSGREPRAAQSRRRPHPAAARPRRAGRGALHGGRRHCTIGGCRKAPPDRCSSSPRHRAAARRASSTRCSRASPASGCRCRTRRASHAPANTTASTTTSSTRSASRRSGQGRVPRARARARPLVRDVGDLARRAGRARTGRAARDRLAGRAAGPPAAARSVHIFMLPPSLAVLEERLEKRGQDGPGGDRARGSPGRSKRCATGKSSIMLLSIKTLRRP